MSIDTMIEDAVFSFEMEGFEIDEEMKQRGRMLLEGKITMEEYIQLSKKRIGITD